MSNPSPADVNYTAYCRNAYANAPLAPSHASRACYLAVSNSTPTKCQAYINNYLNETGLTSPGLQSICTYEPAGYQNWVQTGQSTLPWNTYVTMPVYNPVN